MTWVVKLGGSLAHSPRLRDWLGVLGDYGGGRVVVAPGGGPYADLVRAEQAAAGFDDAAAHRMAILAMEQFALVLESLGKSLRCVATEDEMRGVLAAGEVPVWFAWPLVVREADLPEDWSVTADSLALWLAIRLGASRLVLVKSAALTAGADLRALSRAGMVDGYFPALAPAYAGAISWLKDDEAGRFGEALVKNTVPGSILRVTAEAL